MKTFANIKHFSRSENWGDTSKLNPFLIPVMDIIRGRLGYPIYINNAYQQDGHTDGSQHYIGNAVDFIVKGIDFKTAIIEIERILEELGISDYVGLGIYPDWNTAGFHIDIRGYKARWGRLSGKYVSYEMAKKYAMGKT